MSSSQRSQADNAFQATVSGLQQAMLVQHVCSAPLRMAHAQELVATTVVWAEPAAINNVPVHENGIVVGVLENLNGELSDWPRTIQAGTAVDAMQRLSGGMLIEAREPLDGLIDILLEPPHYRLVLRSGLVDAIVTPSDLSKLPMRVLAFGMLAHLETTMSAAIRATYSTDEDAISALGAGGAAQVLGKVAELHEKNLEPSLLEVTSLKQKGEILATAGIFEGERDAVVDELTDLYEQLRNPLMHAAKFVDDSVSALRNLDRRLGVVRRRTAEATAAAGQAQRGSRRHGP